MKILWVKAGFLHPTRAGGQIRTLETLKRLHQWHEIHYAALDLPEPGAGMARSTEYCTHAYAVPHFIPKAGGPRYQAELARGLFSRLPLAVLRYRSAALKRKVEALTRQRKFDAVVCDFLSAASSIPELGNAILFQHNVESVIWKRNAEHAHPLLHKIYLREQHARMLRYEKRICQSVKRIVAVSEADAETMRSLYGAQNVHSVPTGVDLDYFAPPLPAKPTTDLAFLGSMDWRANIDGIRWFVTDVLPRIRRRRRDCSLSVVGRRPNAEIVRLGEADPRIHVTGTVDDVRPYLWESAVSIVPLRIGGGTRLKIYEAMAARIPVVSTTIGAEGLDVRDGENVALADSPEAFAERCLALLEDAEARRKQAQSAWEMVAACYSWEVVARKFEQFLHDPLP
jgi:glycosyltransferase involved in cell wall biosynthesis